MPKGTFPKKPRSRFLTFVERAMKEAIDKHGGSHPGISYYGGSNFDTYDGDSVAEYIEFKGWGQRTGRAAFTISDAGREAITAGTVRSMMVW